MRLARFTVDGVAQTGRVEGDEIHLIGGDLSLDTILGGGSEALEASRDHVATQRYGLEDVRLLAPVVSHARCVFATGWNYRLHFAEGQASRGNDVKEPTVPTFFSKPATTIIGPLDPIAIDDRWSHQFDYEAELAVVIGRRGRDITAEVAMSHVFGYMASNDVSARDVQDRHGGQWFKGKGIDGTCPLGPWIVTADEIPDPDALTIECLVNGETRQQANTGSMAFSIPRLIQELSTGMTLFPGDVLLTGTPAGVGKSREPPSFLALGDDIVTRISRIGELRNSVVDVNGPYGLTARVAGPATSPAGAPRV